MARKPDLDITATVVVALVGTLLIVSAILALDAYYRRTEDRLFAETYSQPILEVQKVRAEQLELLAGYSLPESGAGTIRIPIDRAIEVVAREYAEAQARASAQPEGGK